jgi:hypothetical protein
MTDPLSIVPPKKKPKHVVIPEKQHIIRDDGVEDAKAYNKCDQMPLFIDFIKKIGVVEKKPTQRRIAMGTKRCEVENYYGGGD